MSSFSRNLKYDIKNGLVGYWKFDEGTGSLAFDSTPNNNVGTLLNSPSRISGKKGGALMMNGTNNSVQFSSSTLTLLDNVDKSFTAWIKPTTLSQYGIIDKDFDSGAPNYGGWGLWLQSNGKLWWWVEGGLDLLDSGSQSISAGQWSHVAVTWSNSTKSASFYINGILNSVQTNAIIVEKVSGSAVLVIGAIRSTLDYFNGGIDEVRAYNRVLSASEINAIYRS